ncbi:MULTISPECIES: Gfo/Idh/MocA family protein [Chelativorans]|jgi:predicted dehydrogenase|uniref:Oxidoreductase-like protein n=1 Tax=Chelativorans sp. (strain BNC1) TaxID=266779 RepID=Q11AQ7_CHESB|nr:MULTISPECIES: Gfo/Idh/MocA family oxidoreductase [Chelativorans]
MQDATKLGLGVVGLGMVAATHARALQDLCDLIAVRGVFARDPRRRADFAGVFGFPAAESVEELIRRDDVDAILVLTPPNARMEIVEAAFNAGKHVLLEKPIERDSAAAGRIVEMCCAAGVTLGVTFQHRFREASQALKGLIDGGSLGAVCAVRVSVPWWRDQSYYDVPGRGTYARDGGGVLISQAIHTLDLMIWLLGLPEAVTAMAATTGLHRMEAEDFVAGALRWPGGAVGSLTATTAAFPGRNEYIVVDFERASACLEGGELVVRHHDSRTEIIGTAGGSGGGVDPMAFTHEWHRSAIEDFARAIAGGRAPVVSGESALQVHRLIDALLASASEGRQVLLNPH